MMIADGASRSVKRLDYLAPGSSGSWGGMRVVPPAPPTPPVAETGNLQAEMWNKATELARRAPTPISASLIAALKEMFDASLAQRFAFTTRVPSSLEWTLLAGSILAVGAMGYQLGSTGSRQAILSVLSLLMWAGALVLILDFDRARQGTIRFDPAPLIWTIEGFGAGGANLR